MNDIIKFKFINLKNEDEFAIQFYNAILDIKNINLNGDPNPKIKSLLLNKDFDEQTKNFFTQNSYQEYNQNSLVIPITGQYFHDIVDVFGNILRIIENKINPLVLFINKNNLNFFETNFYFFEILNYFNINYKIIDQNIDYIKTNPIFFYHKIPYLKRNGNYPEELEINPAGCFFEPSISETKFINGGILHFKEVIDIYRKYFYNENIKNDKKFYIKRKNFRRDIKDSEKLENYFLNKGYEIIELDNMSFFEQIKIFNSAKYLISFSGSSFTNIIFCKPNTKILEIRNKKNFEVLEIKEISNILDLDFNSLNAFFDNSEDILKELNSKNSERIKQFL